MENFPIDEKLAKMLHNVFGWSQTIRIGAQKTKNDGIDDDALIIQELIEDYLHDCGINPRDVIRYEEFKMNGERRYDTYYDK